MEGSKEVEILTWIQNNRPGIVEDLGDRLEISHQSGECSTLWKRTGNQYLPQLTRLGDCYTQYDGIDLFSSTFKLASTYHPQQADGVQLTFTLDQIAREAKANNCGFPLGSVPFMYQAGIGYYAVAADSPTVYEWDMESGELSDEFESLEAILTEWISAIG